MKVLTLIAVLFFANSVFACPELTGTYICEVQDEGEENETYNLAISQRVEDGVAIYSFTDDGNPDSDLITDGVFRELPQGKPNGKFKAECSESALSLTITQSNEDQGWDLLAVIDYTINKGDDLQLDTVINYNIGEDEYEDESQEVCTRIK